MRIKIFTTGGTIAAVPTPEGLAPVVRGIEADQLLLIHRSTCNLFSLVVGKCCSIARVCREIYEIVKIISRGLRLCRKRMSSIR